MRWPVSHLVKLSGLLWPPRAVRSVRPAQIHYHDSAERERAQTDTRAS